MGGKLLSGLVLLLSAVTVYSQSTATTANSTMTPTTAKTTNASTTSKAPPPVPVNECLDLEQEACCGVTNCTFVTCVNASAAGQTFTGCQKKDDLSTVCANSTDPENLCNNSSSTAVPPASPTTPNATSPKTSDAPSSATPPDPCESFSNQTACCGTTTATCSYISCSDPQGQPHTGCHLNTTDAKQFCKDDLSDLKDLCKQSQTTQPPTEGPTTASGGGTTGTGNSSSTTTPNPGDQNAQTGGQGSGQKFDGASFVGGMVLMAGLVGIVFFGCKFYKARTERNYHTL